TYPQFCALARAAEVFGERWTPLVVRELLLGPKRFVDLRRRLDGVSASVLTERLVHLEAAGLVRRETLDPPAAVAVYALTEDGEAFRPVAHALIRWGARRLLPPRRGERVEAEWVRLALEACARRSPVPERMFLVQATDEARPPERAIRLVVRGDAQGTTVEEAASATPRGAARGGVAAPDATLTADARTVLGLAAGVVSPAAAARAGQLLVTGDRASAADFPLLFEVHMPRAAEQRGHREDERGGRGGRRKRERTPR
ncbi:MAG TPA: winged helix-turn-helix transcriptional regulator, partial [Chloroflexota bacterium]|nr:winged helix-turn-helix transcriptional regulator [Chloroflexota bacterium]